MKKPFGLWKRNGIYYWRTPEAPRWKSTGKTSKKDALDFVLEKLEELKARKAEESTATLRQYLNPFFVWDRCPHIRRLLDENKPITQRYATSRRYLLEKHILKDKLADNPISKIRRASILDFRSRLLKKVSPSTTNSVIGLLKIAYREGIYREELDRNPTEGIGLVRYEKATRGIFSLAELQLLFPFETLGPWKDLVDYTCFLLAASTGLRRGEILAVRWEQLHLSDGYVLVDRAWKDAGEEGPPKWSHIRSSVFVILRDRVQKRLQELGEQSVHTTPGDYVFCYDDGLPLGFTWWKKRFDAAMKQFGVDSKTRKLSPHSFRHSIASLLRGAGKDPALIRESLGWRQERTQEGYTHIDVENLRDLRMD